MHAFQMDVHICVCVCTYVYIYISMNNMQYSFVLCVGYFKFYVILYWTCYSELNFLITI